MLTSNTKMDIPFIWLIPWIVLVSYGCNHNGWLLGSMNDNGLGDSKLC
jgi:hypothetical protein